MNYKGFYICPKCGNTFEFKTSKRAKLSFMLGEKPYKAKSLVDSFDMICDYCNEHINMKAIIKNGQIVDFNHKYDEVSPDDYDNIPDESYLNFSYKKRAELFLGEDNTRFVKLSDFDFPKSAIITVFNRKWITTKIYKEVDVKFNPAKDTVDTYVCEVTAISDRNLSRILILKENCFPTLREVDWRKSRKTGIKEFDDLKELKRYSLPKGRELILCL